MRSRTFKQFRKRFAALPKDVQKQAYKQYRLFKRDPWHNSLQFKQVHPSLPVYSARVTKGYRVVCKRDENGVLWFWIGTHPEYENPCRSCEAQHNQALQGIWPHTPERFRQGHDMLNLNFEIPQPQREFLA